MIETWLLECAKGIGRFFLNPLLYWTILLVVIAGYKRIKQERYNFGFKVFDVFSEWKNTGGFSLLVGFFISIVFVGLGIVFSYETILLLSVIMIILSISTRFTLLSASYTIGLTYLLLLFLPFLLAYQPYVNMNLFNQTNFIGLVLLLGFFLMIESFLLRRTKRNGTFPEIVLSKRGVWVGQHYLKKLAIIPFFVLIPNGLITSFAPFWPYISLGDETYSLVLVPFLLGFNFTVKGSLPQEAAQRIASPLMLLGMFVILLGIGSIYLSWLSLVAIIVAILGREYINYRHRTADKEEGFYFNQIEDGLRVLGVIPRTPADRLHILIGETIKKVNDHKINNVKQFYEALQNSGAFFKLEVIDDKGEVRFVQSAFYEEDHHELGLIFTDKPYRRNV